MVARNEPSFSVERTHPSWLRCVPHVVVIAVSLLCGGFAGSFALTVRLCLTWYVGMADLISLWVGYEKLTDGRAHWLDNLLISAVLTVVLILLWR